MTRSTIARRNVVAPPALNGSIATTQYYVIDLDNAVGFSVQHNYVDGAPAAKTFVDGNVDVTANTITIAAHPFVTG
jgi:hypothetical protein